MPAKRRKSITVWRRVEGSVETDNKRYVPQIPNDYNMSRDGITQSLCSTLVCPWRFLFAINRWTDPNKWNNVSFGTLVHEILEKIYTYKRGNISKTPSVIDKWVDDFEDNRTGAIEKETELNKLMASVILKEYIKHYKEDFTTKKFTDVEEEFNVDYRGFRLRGKKDGRYKSRKDGKVWILENKTKSRIDEAALLQRLSMDFQSLFYVVCDEMQHNEPVSGVLYNIIRKPQIQPKKNERLVNYKKRLLQDIRERPNFYFIRYTITYTEYDKRNFLYELGEQLWQTNLMLQGKYPIFKQRFACEKPYNCDYLKICTTGSTQGFEQKKTLFEELSDGDNNT